MRMSETVKLMLTTLRNIGIWLFFYFICYGFIESIHEGLLGGSGWNKILLAAAMAGIALYFVNKWTKKGEKNEEV